MVTDDQPILINRVRFAETDLQGVVFYGTFFTYQDETVKEYFRQIGHPYSQLADDCWTTHVVHTELNYFAPAHFEDQIQNTITISSIGDSSFTAEYAARRQSDGTMLATGSVTHVAINPESGDTIRVPDDFRAAVIEFQNSPPDQI